MNHVTWITLNPDSARGKRFAQTCKRIGMEQTAFIAKRGDTSNLVVSQGMRKRLTVPEMGCLSSHMEMIKRAAWSSDPWFFVCEDDADLSWMEDIGTNFERFLECVPRDADCVIMHSHFRPLVDMFKPARFFKNAVGNIPSFEPGMANYTCLAYLLRPQAARAVMDRYYSDGKWRGLPPLPSDVLFEKFYRDGLWTMYTVPVIGEMNFLDSELTKSSLVLRVRRASGNAMHRALMSPDTHKTTLSHSVEMAKSLKEEFKKEVVVGSLLLASIGVCVAVAGTFTKITKK